MKSEKRLIDANKLIDSLKEWLSASNVVVDWDVYHTIEDCICEVNEQPTIDAVEVVRCEDFKHFESCEEVEGVSWTGFCNYGEFYTDEYDFCSRGERRCE